MSGGCLKAMEAERKARVRISSPKHGEVEVELHSERNSQYTTHLMNEAAAQAKELYQALLKKKETEPETE